MSDQLLKNMLVAEKQHKLPKKISIDDIQVPDTAPTKKKKKRKGSVNSATPQPSSNSSTLNNTKKKRKRKKTKSNQLDTIKTRKNSTSSTSSSPRKSSITPQKEPKEGKEPVLNLSTPKTKRKGKGKHGRQRSNSDFGIVAKQIIKHDQTDEIAPKKPKDDTYLTTNTTNTKKRTSTKKKKKKDNDPSVKSSKTKKNGRSSTLTPRPSSARSRSSSVSPSSSPSPKKKSITKSKSPKQSPSTPTVAKKPSTPKVSRMRSSSVASGRDSRPKQRSSSPRKSKKAKSARPKAPKLEKITADEENKADEWGKEKKDRVSSPIVIRINDKKYSGIATPKTPKKARAFANSKGKLDSKKRKELEQELKQQKLEYLKMQKMYREIKKDLNVLKQEKKVIEIEKRRLKKDQGKLQRDLEQFQVDQRTFGLKKENQGASGKKKHGIDDIDKLRKMLYSERKQFNEERKQYRSEILRLTNELTGLRHMDEKKRMSIYKQDIKHSFGNRNETKLKNRHNDGMDKYNVYNRQQKELTKFIQIEKQKAMKDLNAERRKLQILAKQLKADHQRLKMQQARTRNKWAPRTPRQDPALYVDKTVKKIYIKPRKQKPFRRQADIIKYQPVNTRIVYRDLRKKVVLRTTDWETKIKYINAKGKQLNTIKTKIITLEDKINKKHRGRKRKKVNKKARNRIPSVSTSQYQGGTNNEGADDDDNKDDNNEDEVDEQDNELDENEQGIHYFVYILFDEIKNKKYMT